MEIFLINFRLISDKLSYQILYKLRKLRRSHNSKVANNNASSRKQAPLKRLGAAKAFNFRLLDAPTIIASHLLWLTIILDAYLVDLLALKEVRTHRLTDRQTDGHLHF